MVIKEEQWVTIAIMIAKKGEITGCPFAASKAAFFYTEK
ncbi:hypothetical protein B14911_13682 [Bacillus sp. NRRL B-14911]|nr:hypothetical protein B14911_13682 [Bacillus sp. NRRL B-14911]